MHTTLNSQRAGYQEEFTFLDPSGPLLQLYIQHHCLWHTPWHHLAPCNLICSMMIPRLRLTMNLKQIHLLGPSTTLLNPICQHPSPNSVNLAHSMALIHANSGPSSFSVN